MKPIELHRPEHLEPAFDSAKRGKAKGVLFLLVAVLLSAPPNTYAAEENRRTARLGFVGPGTPFTAPKGIPEFWARLKELGWVRGQNLIVEERWAEGHMDQLPALMDEIVGYKADVIVTYSTTGGLVAKKATSTIPIVNAIMGNPVETGLIASLAHPGGNITGLSANWTEGFPGKWLEFLHDTLPKASSIAVVMDPDSELHAQIFKDLQAAAPARKLKLRIVPVREAQAIPSALREARRRASAALVLPSPIYLAQRQQIASLAIELRLPTIFAMRDYVEAGGLMAYGPDTRVMFSRAAKMVDRILNGTKPSDLPVEQPTRYSLVVNLKTAKAINVSLPEIILTFADELIQ